MARGYLRTAGGTSRIRIVQPGYDAYSASVPPNKVVFDSDDIGTLSIIHTGSYTLPKSGNVSNLQIASWSALPFVPLCLFRFQIDAYGAGYSSTWNIPDTTNDQSRMIVSNSDIRIWYNLSNWDRSVTVHWAATRFAVA